MGADKAKPLAPVPNPETLETQCIPACGPHGQLVSGGGRGSLMLVYHSNQLLAYYGIYSNIIPSVVLIVVYSNYWLTTVTLDCNINH